MDALQRQQSCDPAIQGLAIPIKRNITFDGQLKKKADDEYKLVGNLTIRDITKEVELGVEYGGTMVDGYGQTKAGFEIEGAINRKEFGLKWDMVTEAGGVVVADKIKLSLNIQLARS